MNEEKIVKNKSKTCSLIKKDNGMSSILSILFIKVSSQLVKFFWGEIDKKK